MARRQPARFAYPPPPSAQPFSTFNLHHRSHQSQFHPSFLLWRAVRLRSSNSWGGGRRDSTRRRINLCAIPFYSILPLPFEIGGENSLSFGKSNDDKRAEWKALSINSRGWVRLEVDLRWAGSLWTVTA